MALTTRSDFGRNLLDFCAEKKRKRATFFQLEVRRMADVTRANGVQGKYGHSF